MATDRSRRAAMTLLGWEPIDWGQCGAMHQGKSMIVYLVLVSATREAPLRLRAQYYRIPPGHDLRRRVCETWYASETALAVLYDAVMECEGGKRP